MESLAEEKAEIVSGIITCEIGIGDDTCLPACSPVVEICRLFGLPYFIGVVKSSFLFNPWLLEK